MALSFGLITMTWPTDLSGWHEYTGGTTMNIRWSYSLWSGTTGEMDQAGYKMYFRLYNAAGEFMSLGSAYLSKKYHDYNPNLMVGSAFVRFKYFWKANNVAPTDAEWAAASFVTITIVAPPAPNKPVITAPVSGAEVYKNAQLPVAWNYSDPKNLAQAKREITAVSDQNTVVTLLSGSSSEKAYTIPAGAFTLPAGVRKGYFTLYVSVSNGFNPAFTKSDGVMIGVKATSPDKPVPSKPAANAVSYPLAALDVAFGYTAHGGYELAQVVFEYYKEGETAWGRRLTYTTEEPEIQLPSNTFTVGTWFWRVTAVNSAGESSQPSDVRRLTVAASAPLTPVLTAPAAGSTQYNHVSVAYEWTYRNNAGVPQGAAQLQYRRSTESAWVTVDIIGAQDTAYVEHGAVDAAIVWRVRTKNELGEWSPWSETGTYALATPLPTCSAAQPLSGYVNPDVSQVFSWAAGSPIGAAIAAYELRYKSASAGSWTTLTGGSETSRTLPGGTLPEVEKVSWQVRVQDASGRWSAWSPAIEITTADVPPNAPTLRTPIDVYLSVSDAVRFSWTHNSPIGTAQGGAEVRYQQGGGVWNVVSVDGDAASLQIAAFILVTGACLWQARTKNTDDVPGDWSAVASFTVVGAAVTPTILAASANGARPSLRWTAPGQIVYEVQAWLGGVMIGQTIAAAEADDGEYRMPDFTTPGMVTLKVRDQNAFGYWSDWAETSVQVAAGVGAAPEISATAASDGLAIDLNLDYDWTDGHRVALYRNGRPVAMMDANGYTDYAVRSGEEYHYLARAIHADGTYIDSNALDMGITLPHATIAPSAAPEDLIPVRFNMDDGPEYGRQTDTDCEQVVLAGRALPVTQYGEHRTAAYSLRAAMAQTDFEKLIALKFQNAPVLYRDAYGRRDHCRLASVVDYGAVRKRNKAYVLVSIALDAMDYDEMIPID